MSVTLRSSLLGSLFRLATTELSQSSRIAPTISAAPRHYSKEAPAADAAATDAAKPVDGAQAAELGGRVETLTTEVKQLNEKNAELLDKYKRSLAETENLRARLTKQIDDAKRFGIQGFCKDLLEVADILGHATQAVPKAELADQKNVHLKNLYEGLTMTRDSLLQVFKRNGLVVVDPLNEKFNPNFHEALFQKPTTELAPDHVVEVTKVGYKLHERCIRPALVGVSRQ